MARINTSCLRSVALTAALVAGPALAMGLGEIESQSALGAPLDLLIPLSTSAAEEVEGATLRVSDDAVDHRSGLHEAAQQQHLTAGLVEHDGKPYVRVSSRVPAVEPLMNLQLEIAALRGVTWRREYSLLLDPVGEAAAGSARRTVVHAGWPRPGASSGGDQEAPVHPQGPRPTQQRVWRNDPVTIKRTLVAEPAASAVVAMAPVTGRSLPARATLPATTDLASLPPSAAMPHPDGWRLRDALAVLGRLGALATGLAASPRFWSWLPVMFGFLVMLAAFKSTMAMAAVVHPAMAATLPQALAVTEPAHQGLAIVPAAVAAATAARALPPQQDGSAELQPEYTPDFYQGVATLLTRELQHDPKRTDLRHKLLEVYFASGAREDFREHTRRYLEQLQGRADEHWPSIVSMGRELLPDSTLYTDTPPLLESAVVLPATPLPQRTPTFQRFYEAVNQARLSARQAELERVWESKARDPGFQSAFAELLQRHLKRPTPLLAVDALPGASGAKLYRKFEDQRGADDNAMINALGQVLLASRMGKKRVVAASISGSHGAAVAQAAQALGLDCSIYMKAGDQHRTAERVRTMHDCGASVITVHPSMVVTSDDVRIRALDDWMQDGDSTLFINSVDAGPYPYPSIVLHLQSVIGREARAQMLESSGCAPDAVVTSTADGPSAVALLQSFIGDTAVRLYCVDPASQDGSAEREHQFRREHSWLKASGRVSYLSVAADEAQAAIRDAETSQGWTLDAAGGEVLACSRTLAAELGTGRHLLFTLPRPAQARAMTLPLRAAAG